MKIYKNGLRYVQQYIPNNFLNAVVVYKKKFLSWKPIDIIIYRKGLDVNEVICNYHVKIIE